MQTQKWRSSCFKTCRFHSCPVFIKVPVSLGKWFWSWPCWKKFESFWFYKRVQKSIFLVSDLNTPTSLAKNVGPLHVLAHSLALFFSPIYIYEPCECSCRLLTLFPTMSAVIFVNSCNVTVRKSTVNTETSNTLYNDKAITICRLLKAEKKGLNEDKWLFATLSS